MIVINQYRLTPATDGSVIVRCSKNFTCPHCNGKLVVRDTKIRKIITQEGNKMIFRLQRMKCKCCGQLHTIIPSCIVPFKHYAVEVIVGEMTDSRADCPADNSTSNRWKQLLVKILACSFILRKPRAKLKYWLAYACAKMKNMSKPHPLCIPI